MNLSTQGKKEIEAMIEKHRRESRKTLQKILENLKGTREMNRKLGIMLQKIIKRGKDLETLKEIYHDHERRLQKVER